MVSETGARGENHAPRGIPSTEQREKERAPGLAARSEGDTTMRRDIEITIPHPGARTRESGAALSSRAPAPARAFFDAIDRAAGRLGPTHISGRALALLVAVLALALSACTQSPERAILTAATLQAASAGAYDAAKGEQTTAVRACKAAARAASVDLPPASDPAAVSVACAGLGKPLPYPSDRLASLAGPINALHEAVRGAFRVYDAKGDLTLVIPELLGHMSRLLTDLGVLGPRAPTKAMERAAEVAR